MPSASAHYTNPVSAAQKSGESQGNTPGMRRAFALRAAIMLAYAGQALDAFPRRAVRGARARFGRVGGARVRAHDQESRHFAQRAGRDRARHERLCRARHRAGRARRQRTRRDRDGHARRSRHLDARHHPSDSRIADSGRYVRVTARRARCERRNVHLVREPCGRDGARHERRRSDARLDRRSTAGDGRRG